MMLFKSRLWFCPWRGPQICHWHGPATGISPAKAEGARSLLEPQELLPPKQQSHSLTLSSECVCGQPAPDVQRAARLQSTLLSCYKGLHLEAHPQSPGLSTKSTRFTSESITPPSLLHPHLKEIPQKVDFFYQSIHIGLKLHLGQEGRFHTLRKTETQRPY